MAFVEPGQETLWEAYAGGEGWGQAALAPGDPSSIYEPRSKAFFTGPVSSLFGVDPSYVEQYSSWMPSLDPTGFEQAEKRFRMETGDIFGDESILSWETMSRMPQGELGEIKEDLLGLERKQIGGEIGAEYGTGSIAQSLSYESGSEDIEEGVTHGALVAGTTLQSGTSGATLRSGSAITSAESILDEAATRSRALGSTYVSERKRIENELKTNLQQSLNAYHGELEIEKGNWYDDITYTVDSWLDSWLTTEEGTATDFIGGYGDPKAYAEEHEWQWGTGIDYGTGANVLGDPLGDPCGIGELRDADGNCIPLTDEEGNPLFDYDAYGVLCPIGQTDACGVCNGPATSSSDCFGWTSEDIYEGGGEEDGTWENDYFYPTAGGITPDPACPECFNTSSDGKTGYNPSCPCGTGNPLA